MTAYCFMDEIGTMSTVDLAHHQRTIAELPISGKQKRWTTGNPQEDGTGKTSPPEAGASFEIPAYRITADRCLDMKTETWGAVFVMRELPDTRWPYWCWCYNMEALAMAGRMWQIHRLVGRKLCLPFQNRGKKSIISYRLNKRSSGITDMAAGKNEVKVIAS